MPLLFLSCIFYLGNYLGNYLERDRVMFVIYSSILLFNLTCNSKWIERYGEKVFYAVRNRFKKSQILNRSFVVAKGAQRYPLWAVSGPKIAHVLGFPTRIARSRPALERERTPRREKDGAHLGAPLCRARVLRQWKLKVSSTTPHLRGPNRAKWQCARLHEGSSRLVNDP